MPKVSTDDGVKIDDIRCDGQVVMLDDLVHDPNNANTHPERNILAIMRSLQLYGQRSPLVVRAEGMVVMAGNGRLTAMHRLGWTRCACSIRSMTDAEANGFGLADNRTAQLAVFDMEVVARLDRMLADDGGEMVGWTVEDLTALRMGAVPQQSDPDRIPEPPGTPVTCLGDLWRLGDHKLMCGDSADKDVVKKLMDQSIGKLCATDPPYGVEFGKANHNPRAKVWDAVAGDNRAGNDLRKWLASVLSTWIRYIAKDSSFYIWSAPLGEGHRFYEAVHDAGLHVQSQVVWAKNVFALGQADYQWKHELCWYAFWKGRKHRWYGGRDKTTVWEVRKVNNADYLHPMQKPVELYERPMEHHTLPGDVVVEPFTGSGTQFIAAQKLGRVCYGMELDPVYCDVTLQRWADFTGLDPVRERDGMSFKMLKQKQPTR